MNITVRVVDSTSQPVAAAQVVVLSGNGTTLSGTTDGQGQYEFEEAFPEKSRHVLVAATDRPGGLALRSPSDPSTTLTVVLGDPGNTGSIIGGPRLTIPGLGSINPKRDSRENCYIYGDNLTFDDSHIQPYPYQINETFTAANAHGARVTLCIRAALSQNFLVDYTPA